MGDEDIEQLVEHAAADNSPVSRQRLFRAIRSSEVFFPYKVERHGDKEVKSTPLARLADGSHAMMLFTSKSHPALAEHERFAGSTFAEALAAALKMPPLDWVVLWNSASQRVPIAKEQISDILEDISQISYRRDDDVAKTVSETLEEFITSAVRSNSADLPAPVGSVIGGRELFLELGDEVSDDGRPSMPTFQIQHLDHVIRAYTSRLRPGIKYGGITWQELKDMIGKLPHISGVQIMNNADDWIVFDREALGLKPSNES
jgi:hypothetical protein